MITELVLFIPSALLAYYGGLFGQLTALSFISTYYWIPKYPVFELFLNKLYPQVITHNKKITKKNIALTFDDVPYPGGNFEKILKTLNEYEMKATFFIISDYVTTDNRPLLVAAVKRGHQLGNHGKTNSIHAIKTTYGLNTELDECDRLIREIYRDANKELPQTMVYRPGCGLFTSGMINQIEKKGYKLTLGSVYPNDSIVVSGTINYHYLTQHIEKGDIVILHDRKWTYPMINYLCHWLSQNDYSSVTVNNLFN